MILRRAAPKDEELRGGHVASRPGEGRAGDAHGAWVKGLVSSLLPPLHVVNLIGAILCLVIPEGEAAKRARTAAAQPL